MRGNQLSSYWKYFNALSFIIAGTSFTVASGLNFALAQNTFNETIVAVFYIVGSVAFLAQAIQDFITYCKGNFFLVFNLFLSKLSYALYIVGAVGFFPFLKENPSLPISRFNPIGTFSFIVGSGLLRYSYIILTPIPLTS